MGQWTSVHTDDLMMVPLIIWGFWGPVGWLSSMEEEEVKEEAGSSRFKGGTLSCFKLMHLRGART